ncbi:MAG: hypothetical protein M3419_03500 [Actinomycetota bacterium]|nr:hypothetical protein [Actinomycetota bacterium]
MSRLPLDGPISLDGRWVELPLDTGTDIDSWLDLTLPAVAARAGWPPGSADDLKVRQAWSAATRRGRERAAQDVLRHAMVGVVAWTPSGARSPMAVLDVAALRLPEVPLMGMAVGQEVDRFFAEVRAEAAQEPAGSDGMAIVGAGAVRVQAPAAGAPFADDLPYVLAYVWQQPGSGCVAAVGVVAVGSDTDVLGHLDAFDDLVTTLELRRVPERRISIGLVTALAEQWSTEPGPQPPVSSDPPMTSQPVPLHRPVPARRTWAGRLAALGRSLRVPLLCGAALAMVAVGLSLVAGSDSGFSLALWGGSLVGAVCFGGLGLVFCVLPLLMDLDLRPGPGDTVGSWVPYVVTVLGCVSIIMFVVVSAHLLTRGEQLF